MSDSSAPARSGARRPAARRLAPVLAILILTLLAAPASGAVEPAPSSGRWPWEPPPVVVQGFDPPDTPWGAGHRGVDLLGSPGQPVHASLAGSVRFAGMLAGRPVVVVDHGAVRTTYEPVEPAAGLTVGARIGAGALLGRLVTAGSHCPPRTCLHWGLIRNADDVYLDPLSLVGGGPVRLLPWDAAGPAAPAAPATGAALSRPSRLSGLSGPVTTVWIPLVAALGLPAAVASVIPPVALPR